MPFNQDNRINDNQGNIYNFNINLCDTAPERTPPYTSTVYNLDPTDISQTGQPINLERPRLVPTLDGDILELEDRGSLVSKIGAISTSGLRGLHVDVNGTPEVYMFRRSAWIITKFLCYSFVSRVFDWWVFG